MAVSAWMSFRCGFAYDEGSRVTSTAYGDAPDDLAALMRVGSTARIDAEHHVLKGFAPRGDVDMPGAVLAQIRDRLGQPVPPVEIEVEKGWTMNAALPGVADVEVTVSAVTPGEVYLRYEGSSEDTRLSGVQAKMKQIISGTSSRDRAEAINAPVTTLERSV